MARRVSSFVVVGVMAWVLLLGVPKNSDATIVANFEGPVSGPVSGVNIIRGWAFDNAGSIITGIEYFLDGTRTGNIPCCSERKDVEDAYGPSALQSGWGLTTNWGNFPAGSHSIYVVVRSNNGGIWTSETRTIVVIKPGDVSFASSLMLGPQSTSWIDGQYLVITDVTITDSATGKKVMLPEVRIKWTTETQNPLIVGPQASVGTTQESVTFEFDAGVTVEDQTLIREASYITAEFLRERDVPITTPLTVFAMGIDSLTYKYLEYTGLPQSDKATYEKKKRELDGARAVENAVFICTSCSLWTDRQEILKVGIASHELAHLILQHQWFDWSYNVPYFGPAWLIEGPANLVPYCVMDIYNGGNGSDNFKRDMDYVRSFARGGTGNDLKKMETYQGLRSMNKLDVAIIATFDISGGDFYKLSLVWRAIAKGVLWQDAFRTYLADGRSVEEIYATYQT